MKVRFLGTSSTEGIPGIFCNCPVCTALRARMDAGDPTAKNSVRTRTQTMIDDEILVDFGPDTYYHALKNGLRLGNLGYILMTHSHNDHFEPQDLAMSGEPYAHGMKYDCITVIGSSQIETDYRYFTEMMHEGGRGKVRFSLAQPFVPQKAGEYTVTALPSLHMQNEETFVYLIEKGEARVFICNDTGILPEETFRYLENYGREGKPLSLMACDCALGDTNYPYKWHMGVKEVLYTRDRLKEAGAVNENTKVYINHISHDYGHREYEIYSRDMAKDGVLVSKDGLAVTLEERV